jgi:hypothetical protein
MVTISSTFVQLHAKTMAALKSNILLKLFILYKIFNFYKNLIINLL